jgi:hypothetical protein
LAQKIFDVREHIINVARGRLRQHDTLLQRAPDIFVERGGTQIREQTHKRERRAENDDGHFAAQTQM